MIKKIGLFLASIAPGIFMVGYNIGTGSITTIASSGAAYGMALVWPLLLSCVFTFYLMLVFGRYTSITGNTILFSFKIHFGAVVSPMALILLLLLYNKKKHMGEHSANLTTNLILGIITLFTILMALAGVIGILNLLK